MSMSSKRRGLTGCGLAAAGMGVFALLSPIGGASASPPAGSAPANLAPLITPTHRPPTGYTVTLRFRDPTATRVQIKGEWSFERPSELPQLASTTSYTVQTPGLLPSQWQPGDVPIAYPNSTAANWPVIDMTKNGQGVWTYTTPLPSGVFTYGFFVDCTSPTQSGCTEISDPTNPPWNQSDGTVQGSVEPTSQVYVPSSAAFNTIDFSWQGPARAHGTLADVTYSSPGHVTPAGQNHLAVYTPPGYDPQRAKPYPTLYLNHGGGGNEIDWSTQGDVRNILDNLIADGQIQPLVVVMPNANGYPGSTNNAAFRTDLISNVVPYVEAHYHVSNSPADRAFSGLSAGGLITNQLMLYNPDAFQYYAMMSAGFPPANNTLTDAQATALQGKSIFVGAGWQDPIFAVGFGSAHTGPQHEVGILTAADLPVTPDFVNGGHEWYTWRILLKDFLTRVAFWPYPAR